MEGFKNITNQSHAIAKCNKVTVLKNLKDCSNHIEQGGNKIDKTIKALCEDIDGKIKCRDLDAAMKIADQAVKLYPRDARAWYSRGKVFYYQEQLKDAMTTFEKSMEFTTGYGFCPDCDEDAEELYIEVCRRLNFEEEMSKK